MSSKQISQRGFVAITLITLLALALTIVVYATLLGTFKGGDVGIVAVEGEVKYSLDNSTNWNSTISNRAITEPWYVLFNKTETDGYQGNVKVTWCLYNSTDSVHNVTTTSFNLNSSIQQIYASDNGLQAGNYDWGQNTGVADTYYIKVIIESI